MFLFCRRRSGWGWASNLSFFRLRLYWYSDWDYTGISTETILVFRLRLYWYFGWDYTVFRLRLYWYFGWDYTGISAETILVFRVRLYWYFGWDYTGISIKLLVRNSGLILNTKNRILHWLLHRRKTISVKYNKIDRCYRSTRNLNYFANMIYFILFDR